MRILCVDEIAQFIFCLRLVFGFVHELSGKKTVFDLNFRLVYIFEASLVSLLAQFSSKSIAQNFRGE